MKNPFKKRTSDSAVMWLCSPDAYTVLTGTGYRNLKECPEIQTAVNRVADLISTMTIHLMTNTKDGDVRLKNELSRKIDINPNRWMNRKQWVYSIVRNMMLDGDGNSVHLPHYDADGFLTDLEPLDMTQTNIVLDSYGYHITSGSRIFMSDEVLHFVDNPDPQHPWVGQGYRVLLKDVAKSLNQAAKTKNDLMSSPTPSIIVKVDGLTEEFASVEGRRKLSGQYLDSSENGQPWFIPAEAFSVEQVKPLTLNDLAIKDSISLDKAMAAAVFGVPPFLVGLGDFDKDAYNSFISSIVLPKARGIEQELTRKLLLSPDWYFRFNPRSLYSYSLTEIAEVCANYVDRAIIDRNEARDWSGWTPREGLSELAILENYIPYSKIGQQGKLSKGSDSSNGNAP
ncbi:MAG TPA: phage portal protein [Caproicibacter sp.]|nr:phage portal protein [Caproicibacter sp.]